MSSSDVHAYSRPRARANALSAGNPFNKAASIRVVISPRQNAAT
ncbi:hypothetical protein [Corynebacterium argentoratense]|nr:hypothetical protein [Corynebacterium argentoratense]